MGYSPWGHRVRPDWVANKLVTQLVKNPPAMQETWVQSLGQKDPPEKGKTTHSSIQAWRIPWTVESVGSQRIRHDRDFHFTSLCHLINSRTYSSKFHPPSPITMIIFFILNHSLAHISILSFYHLKKF